MILYILNYNNYYNRLVKKEASLSDYQEYVLYEIFNTNFNPNDGVDTQHILGTGEYDGKGDYLLTVNDNSEIVSRWFIIEAKRTRAGQWLLTLKRDVVVDYFSIIRESPMYIEKGFVNNSSPLVYNSENVTFNQIKKGEYLLPNELKTPWLIAYLSRFHTSDDGTEEAYNSFEGSFKLEPQEADYVLNSLEDYDYFKYTKDNPYIYTDDIKFKLFFRSSADGYSSPNTLYSFVLSKNSATAYTTGLTTSSSYPFCNTRTPSYKTEEARQAAYDECYAMYSEYNTIDQDSGLPINSYLNIGTFDGYKTLSNESGKVIQVGNEYYLIVTTASSAIYSSDNSKNLGSAAGSLGALVYDKLTTGTGTWTTPMSSPNKNTYVEKPFENSGIYLAFKKIDQGTVAYNFDYSHNVTRQTPYEIIAAPLYDLELKYNTQEGGQTVTKTVYHSGTIALQWFLDLGEKHSAGLVYDIQIVPYAPIYDTDLGDADICGCYYTNDINALLAVAVKLQSASFTRVYDIPENMPIDSDYKTAVNCDLYRLCSPNGMGDFDFSIAKNNGLNGFEIDCTLIPYNPYIKINPVFNTTGLYGGDYNDYRGLICKGDFSLPITTDQWETYELNNKNYQAIFDRETTSLEMQNRWAMREAQVNIFTGAATGAAAGAVAGSSLAPGWGTVAGAAVGAVTSAAGGVMDIIKLQSLQEEQMAKRHDQFQLDLQTIRARPNTLSRTSAYNINNKYFPYIEYYSCTDVEKEQFKYKMKYDGMTISAIGKLEDYLNPTDLTFIKGRVIRFVEDIAEDYHIAQEIVNELNRGVYI